MFVELHLLQNFAPSCLNRDDTNTPKDCVFGGHRRARISSQCIKRSVRRYFAVEKLLPPERLAERSKRLLGEVARLLPDRPKELAEVAVRAALAAVKLATDAKQPDETQYLLFLGRDEIQRLASVVNTHWDALIPAADPAPTADPTPAAEPADKPAPKAKKQTAKQKKSEAAKAIPLEVAKAVKAVFDGGKAADVGLFGRMLADQADLNIDAACQVAHAISTSKVDFEMDFFTAVDDLKVRDEDAGAGMLGTVEFNSACFYRYANIHLGQLIANLGKDAELAATAVDAFLKASVNTIPTGKQNTFAAHNPPSLVFVVVRKSGLWSLANAFEKPVRADSQHGLIGGSVAALDSYWGKLVKGYGGGGVVGAAAFKLDDDPAFTALKPYEVSGVAEVYARVAELIAKPGGGAA